MIGYLTIGTNDLDRAIKFYDPLLATIGIQKLWQHGDMAAVTDRDSVVFGPTFWQADSEHWKRRHGCVQSRQC